MRTKYVAGACTAALALAIGAGVPAFNSASSGARSHVVVNEVLYWPSGSHPEWVELYNKGGSTSLGGWRLSNLRGRSIRLPGWTLPPNSYLVVYFGPGRDDRDFSDHRGSYHAGSVRGFLSNRAGGVVLRRPRSIADFVAYSATGKRPEGRLFGAAVHANQWPARAFFRSVVLRPLDFLTTPVSRGDSIGRFASSFDSDRPGDWSSLGGRDALGPTPGRVNRETLGKLVRSGSPRATASGAAPRRQWTVMMLVDPHPIEGRREVEHLAEYDVKKITEGITSTNNINFVVQYAPKKGQGAPGGKLLYFRHLVTRKKLDPSPVPVPGPDGQGGDSTDPSKAETTRDFINWAQREYPARHYIFVYYGHGRGWKGVMRGEDDSLTMSRMSRGLSALGQRFDVVFFHSCLMSMVEVGYQIAGQAQMMVASEEVMYGDVFPWVDFLNWLESAGPNVGAGPVADQMATLFGKAARADHQEQKVRESYTIASVDLATLVGHPAIGPNPAFGLNPALADLARNLLIELENRGPKRDDFTDNLQIEIKKKAQEKQQVLNDPNFRDLQRFAELVEERLGIPAVPLRPETVAAATAVIAALREGAAGSAIRVSESANQHNHGLSIYFPHELDTGAGTERWGDAFDWPLEKFPLATPLQYAHDANIKLPGLAVPHQLPDDAPPGAPPGPGFLFPANNLWDEFLHRYYKPVADACVIAPRQGCRQVVTVAVGTKVTVTGMGSSDSDGKDKDDQPAHRGAHKHWYWDQKPSVDELGAIPAYRRGVLYAKCKDPPHSPEGEDCDRDNQDGTNDDLGFQGIAFEFTCPAPGVYPFQLWTWDEHHDLIEKHKALPNRQDDHRLHFLVDGAIAVVICEAPGGRKDAALPAGQDAALPGDDMTYTIAFEANPQLTGPADADMIDSLPPQVELNGEVLCTTGSCFYDPEIHTVFWQGTFNPGDSVEIKIPVHIPEDTPCPSEIVNQAQTDDGLELEEVSDSTPLVCAVPSPLSSLF
jgi:hypothetical protein